MGDYELIHVEGNRGVGKVVVGVLVVDYTDKHQVVAESYMQPEVASVEAGSN